MTADQEDPLQRLESGDQAALDALVEHNLPALRAYVRLNVPPDVRARESCSDLVQSVCREVIGQRDAFDYRGPEAFRAWLFHWALHKIRDRERYYRAERRAARKEVTVSDVGQLAALYASLGTPSAAAIAHENAEILERAFDALAKDDRQVISLCRIAGLSRGEVAQAMGRSVVAVRTHLSRALVRLGRELEKLGVKG